MSKRNFNLVFLVLIGFVVNSYAQQITTNTSQSLQQLIENNLVVGCVEVSNISTQINGSENGLNSFGYFERASSNFPFANGIVLTTGNVNSAGNTEITQPLNEGDLSWGTDSDLESALEISDTYNATSIQFDFVSVTNTVQFNYILASEEYQQEYPCFYSDGFALLLREAGTNDPFVNIAKIPGTNINVNTNTIHGDISGFCDAENGEYFEGNNIGDTNYNGRTIVMTATANIIPNVTYQIKMIVADQTDQNADTAVFIEGNSFDAVVDLGPDTETCATFVDLNGDIENPLATYEWFLNDTLLNGENTPDLTALQSGTYRIRVTIPINNTECIIEDEIVVTLNGEQTSTPLTDYALCDALPADGVETFDLTIKETEIINSVSPGTYDVTYYNSQSNAESGSSPLATTIQNTNNPQEIFVRIEDPVSGCLAFNSFFLVVNPPPSVNNPGVVEQCDTDGTTDGFTGFDLNDNDATITGGDTNLIVTYHETQAEADSGINAITPPYQNVNNPQQLFVRVVDATTGCVNFTDITIEVVDPPIISVEDLYIDACDQGEDGFADFDLTEIINDVLQGLTGVTLTFHETAEDANDGTNPIADPENYQNTVEDFQAVYIRIQDDSTGCFVVIPLELHVNLALNNFNEEVFILCEEASGNGIADFDLEEVSEDITSPYEGYTLIYYETETDRDNDQNPIDATQPYTVNTTQTLFVRVIGQDCIEFITIDLLVAPGVDIAPQDLEYCDADLDGIALIDLFSFNSTIGAGIPAVNVRYFLTESDANANTNDLTQFFENTVNPTTLWVRVTNTVTTCYDIEPITITVVSSPSISSPSSIIICDNDEDGFFVVDLETNVSEILADTSGFTMSYHTDFSEAELDQNPITDPQNFNATTQDIYVRVESDATGCYSIVTQQVFINTLPEFEPISDFENCEADIANVADFLFNLKDAEILNGQTGKDVLYFETANDAQTRSNSIDKFSAYQNTSSPQTIFVRVENINDQDCFGTSSFELVVGSLPIYTEPEDIFICDDPSNDGLVTLDLSEKLTEISENAPIPLDITFHESQTDANNAENALPLTYTNSFNPQNIFVRIENGTYCHAVAAFEINVISVPTVTQANPLQQCDTDYDGSMPFDLTQIEVQILDVRQDNIEVSYHLTEEDLENNADAIPNPTNYSNISNPQTVFIRVTNTLSNCFLNVPLQLKVDLPPAFNDFQTYQICDNETSSFDLNTIRDVLLNDSNNVNLSYYTSLADANSQVDSLDLNYTYQSFSDTLFVRIENANTGCFYIYDFQLFVNPSPIANTPADIDVCDDDFDGTFLVNLTDQNSQVLNGQDDLQFRVTYHNSALEAESGSNALNTDYTVIDGEVIHARVTNLETECFSTTSFNAFVRRKPMVEIPDQALCIDDLPLTVSADTGFANDEYLWSTGETTSEIDIYEIGTYSVTVTTEFGCPSDTIVFEITESQAAIIEVVETVDFSDPNNITITISGIGDYLYILDNGAPQESNVFENVSLGYHTITIIDLNGCASITREVVVIDAPKFFTPNNDSYNDTWHIAGVETLPGTIVSIFDRYGKLLKTLSSSSPGWDGTYNNNLMPSNDYWFVANVRNGDSTFDVKGHFSLKR